MKTRLIAIALAATVLAACSTTEPEGTATTASTPSAEDTAVAPAAGSPDEFQQVVGDRVAFATDSATLSPEAQNRLRRQADWLQRNGAGSVMIEGHADERGTREYNLALGERRAVSVRDYLVAQGVAADRLRVVSFGKERPICTEPTPACWDQNRRAVTVIR